MRTKKGESPVDEIVNIGARRAISEKLWLLGAVGTGVHGQSAERVHVRIYAGVQLNLPRQFHTGTSPLLEW